MADFKVTQFSRGTALQVICDVIVAPSASPPGWSAVWEDAGGNVLGNTAGAGAPFTFTIDPTASLGLLFVTATPGTAPTAGDQVKIDFSPGVTIQSGGAPVTKAMTDPTNISFDFTGA